MYGIKWYRLHWTVATHLLITFTLSAGASHAALGDTVPAISSVCTEAECKDSATAAPWPRASATSARHGKLVVSTRLSTDNSGVPAGSPDNSTFSTDAMTTAAGRPFSSRAASVTASQIVSPDITVPVSPEAPKRLQTWDIVTTDKTLSAALARWASAAGWQLVWDVPVDYAVTTRASVTGSFEDVVGLVAKSMEGAEIPLKAIFYQGNKVLRIVGKGNE